MKSEQKFWGRGNEITSIRYLQSNKPQVFDITGKVMIHANYWCYANYHDVTDDVTRGQKVTNFEDRSKSGVLAHILFFSDTMQGDKSKNHSPTCRGDPKEVFKCHKLYIYFVVYVLTPHDQNRFFAKSAKICIFYFFSLLVVTGQNK